MALSLKKLWLGSVFQRALRNLPFRRDYTGQNLLYHFESKARKLGYIFSSSQSAAAHSLARRMGPLLTSSEYRCLPPKSLYLFGKVGRGKSWVVDTFFEAAPIAEKRRVHFHEFFELLHQGMFARQGTPDALKATLDSLLQQCRLLCFDEFHVHDIDDAMLISRLLNALAECEILLIITSNYPPEDLLPDPLYHHRFVPVINLILETMEVREIGGENDFRRLDGSGAGQRFTEGFYVWPANPEQRASMGIPTAPKAFDLMVGHRQIKIRSTVGSSIRCNFSELFFEPTATMDYLALCEKYDTWIVDNVPMLADCPLVVQQRFINLVDLLYDQDKRLTLLSIFPAEQALSGTAADLMRTQSRLSQLKRLGPSSAELPTVL